MTTKRRLQSESESGEGGSPPHGSKHPKTNGASPNHDNETDDQPSLPGSGGQSLRVSARVLRKKEEERKESESLSDDVTEAAVVVEEPRQEVANGETGQKKKRSWGCWSAEDQRLFFVALNECGKNFDAIELFFQNKGKKGKSVTGSSAASSNNKHKDQIRTFFYRTWHKICKYIEFPENLKKSWRELYGLINYGELRKKVGNDLDRKKGEKLQELVFHGHTTLRWKGKTIRLKTPMCPALKRLDPCGNFLSGSSTGQDDQKELYLPRKVTLELTPLLVHGKVSFTSLATSLKRQLVEGYRALGAVYI